MVAGLIEEAKGQFPGVHLEEVDITAHPETALKYRVTATPALAINGRLAFRGVPRADALLARLRAAAAEETDGR